MSYELTEEEQTIIDNLEDTHLVPDRANYLLRIRRNLQPPTALAMARKEIAVGIIRRTNPLYGHDDESLMDLYSELKAIEDAETGADREGDYEGTNELDLDMEEIKTYVVKHNMY